MKKLLLIPVALLIAAISFAQTETKIPTAKEVIDGAVKQATAENKNIFVMFHASWCGWCKKMDKTMQDPALSTYFNDNYVSTHLIIMEIGAQKQLENEGGIDYMKKFGGAPGLGIPFWAILDSKGNLLFDSKMTHASGKPGNIGCPAAEDEVKNFIEILGKSSKLKKEALDKIYTEFRKLDPRAKQQ